ncbi:hypothetical protein ACWGAN_24365 [Streptomyces sp. NPDC054945]
MPATTAVRVTPQVGAREAVLAVYAAARTAPGTLRVPATAVNLLPVRLPVRGADTFRALPRAAASELTPVVNLRLFETELDFGGIRGRVVSLASGPVDDLSVSAAGPDGRLRLDFDVNPARYEEVEPARFAGVFTADLMALCRAPDVPVAALRASPTRH